MDTKNLSPAYFTSLLAIFLGAIFIGVSSALVMVLGWLLLILGLVLNVFATLVIVQKAKGGPLPEMIARAGSAGAHEADTETFEEDDDARVVEPEPDTEAQDIVAESEESEERIFQGRRPRVRNR